MKPRVLLRAAQLAIFGIGFSLAVSARAQDTDYLRVVRLSRAEGQVLVSHAGSDAWEEALANLPLQEGDTLETQDGLAEIEFENGATAYLAENSVLRFTGLGFSGGGRATDLNLTQGTGTFYANLTTQDSFRVHTLTLDVAIPSRAEFRVDGFTDGAAVQVLVGNVTVSTSRGSTDLEKGQSVAVHENDLHDFSIGGLPAAEDAFDQWVTEQGEIIRSGNKSALSYVNSPSYYGLSDLSIYGTWINIAGFGFSWRPFSVGFSWTPFFNGKWILDPRLGWIWVSSEPWGWMPYHFGSWLLSPSVGWVWIPGGPEGLRQWQPARVHWVQVGNQTGWVAMSPNDRDGAPANVAQGVIVKPNKSPINRSESNEMVTGKELRNITSIKQPPAELSSGLVSGTSRPVIHSTIRVAPWTPNNNPSIVYDSGTHTFINRDERDTERENSGMIPSAALSPRPDSETGIPRVKLPPSALTDSETKHVILPPSYPGSPAARTNIPATGGSPARAALGVPPIAQPRPITPPPPAVSQTSVPRPAQPSIVPATRAPAQNLAAHTPPPSSNSAPDRH